MKTKLHNIKMNLLCRITNSNSILFHIIGIICIIWFLIRVIPKPDRIRYPCQQMSIIVALGYITFWIILWSTLFHGLNLWIKKARYNITKFTPVILVCFLLIFSISTNVFANINNYDEKEKLPLWDPIPKQPIGTPKGVNPGRVVWIWNSNATEKNLTGYWWEKENNDQKVIDKMFSFGLQKLANTNDDYSTWDHLFKYFNQVHGNGNTGYQTGEKIAIKINLNNCQDYSSEDNNRDASPYVVKSLLRQLINIVGVNQEDITIYDATRPIANWFYNRVYYKEYPADPLVPEFQEVHFVDSSGGASGREKVIASSKLVYFAAGSCKYRTLPTIVSDADYLINMPILKRHPIENGVTLSGKNLFGTWIESVESVHPYLYSSFTMGNPAPQTDLFAHKDIGKKTILYIGDGTYATKINHRTIEKFQMHPFNNDWTNSLFLSQDPVAIDSVMYDFLLAEGTNPTEGSQNYLHQSAEPPENLYDPEKDGVYLSDSLGVHEHWDTTKDIFSSQRYTGPTNNGIDYIAFFFKSYSNGPYYGLINTPLQFHGTVNGGYPPYYWDWDFGDGTTRTEKDSTHIYDKVGEYKIILTVIDSFGNTCTDATTAIITAQSPPPQPPPEGSSENESDDKNLPPNANAKGPFYGFIDVPTTFDGSSSNDPDGIITKYSWSFGDGTSGAEKVITHTYHKVGNYTVILTVTDNYGKTGTYTTFAIIIDKPNIPPDKPSIYGNVTGEKNTNYYYSVISTDQDNDNIKYVFDWDDENNITITDFVQNATSYTMMHSWTNPGVYKIKVSAIDDHNSKSGSVELIVLIDVQYCKDIGYIIDADSDGVYELFHCNTTGNENEIETINGDYLIDSNEDGIWDYSFDLVYGLSDYKEEAKIEETPGFELILIICAITLVLIWKQNR